MKSSKSNLPRKILTLALSFMLVVTWMIPASLAAYAAEGEEYQPESAADLPASEDNSEENTEAAETGTEEEVKVESEDPDPAAGEDAGEGEAPEEEADIQEPEPKTGTRRIESEEEPVTEDEDEEQDEEESSGDTSVLPAAVDGKITLTEDINLAETAVITENTDLDLAGYTVTGPESGTAISVEGGSCALLLLDSSEGKTGKITVQGTESKAIAINAEYASLVMRGGTVEASGQECSGVYVNNGGIVQVRDGNINVSGVGAAGINVYSGQARFRGGSMNASGNGAIGINLIGSGNKAAVTGGEINVIGDGSGYGIQAIEMGPSGHDITVSGGKITASGRRTYAVYLEMDNTFKMSGGELESVNSAAIAFFQGGNTATITGGAIAGGEYTYGINIANAANNTLDISGDAVISGGMGSINAGGNRYKSTPSVTISGGYFNGEVAGGIPGDATDNFAIYDITGGYFTDEIANSALYNYALAKDYTPETYTEAVKAGETNRLVPVSEEKDGVTYNYTIAGLTYVLMNIPYADFYAAELGEGTAEVDGVTSATKNKPRTGTLAGGSYHKNADGTDISGVIYPVAVTDDSLLEGKTEITDESSVDITVTNRGQTVTTTYSGKDALFESPDYSYYRLAETPSVYKTVSTGEDGKLSFSEVSCTPESVEGVTGNVTVGARHADVEITLSGTEGVAQGDKVSGVILTDSDGNKYPLRHIVNIWRATEIGWNIGELDLAGKTISNIRYYTQNSVVDYPVDIAISDFGYVLMNIPYADFYSAELGEGAADVDGVTSATKNKPRTGTLAGGSYHKNADGTDISGVIYPVLVKDLSALADKTEITDESSVDITVTNRGKTTTTTYSGSDALFESPDYSYYRLAEKPAVYKTMTVNEDGSFCFGAVSARASTVEGVTGSVTFNARHANVEIKLSGTTGIEQGDQISGIILTDQSGDKYALRHIANIWRAIEIGWNDEFDLSGKTIKNIRYITQDKVIDYPVEIILSEEIAAAEKANQTAAEKAADAETKRAEAEEAMKTPGENAVKAAEIAQEAAEVAKTAADDALEAAIAAESAAEQAAEDAGEDEQKQKAAESMLAKAQALKEAAETAADAAKDTLAEAKITTNKAVADQARAEAARASAKADLAAAVLDAVTSGITPEAYTDATYSGFESALGEARATLKDPEATAADFKEAQEKLEEAQAALVEKITGKVTILNTIANSAKKTNDVIWDKSGVKGATGYQVSWRAKGASKWTSRNVGNVSRGQTTGLSIGGLYEIRVRPFRESGSGNTEYGEWSNSVFRYFYTTQKIRLKSEAKGCFTMSWAKDANATGYQVLFTTNKNGSGAANNINTVGKNAASFTKKGLKSGATYYVQVREIRKVGNTTFIGNISSPVAVKVK